MQTHQVRLITLLDGHAPFDDEEARHVSRVRAFAAAEEACFHRQTLPGHVTGSAFILDEARGLLLLHHHRKLGKWLQMGGHDDGERDAAATAMREAREESGLTRLRLERLIDVDVHDIPARKDEPAHAHLDVRFLVIGDCAEPLVRDDAESRALQWFPLDEAVERMGEAGARRVIERIRGR